MKQNDGLSGSLCFVRLCQDHSSLRQELWWTFAFLKTLRAIRKKTNATVCCSMKPNIKGWCPWCVNPISNLINVLSANGWYHTEALIPEAHCKFSTVRYNADGHTVANVLVTHCLFLFTILSKKFLFLIRGSYQLLCKEEKTRSIITLNSRQPYRYLSAVLKKHFNTSMSQLSAGIFILDQGALFPLLKPTSLHVRGTRQHKVTAAETAVEGKREKRKGQRSLHFS